MKENVYQDQSLQHYLQEIARTETLSREKEHELALKAKKGDQEAIQKLIESNLKFVVKIATKYQNRGLTLSELISEGNLGLIKAVEKYDPNRDVKLISYAVWWIRQRILFALAEKSNLIRMPLGRANTFTKIRNAQERIRTESGREPTKEELALKTDITKSNIDKFRDNKHDMIYFENVSGGDKYSLINLLSDPSASDPKTIYYREKTNRRIKDSINELDDRSAMVVRSYFGIDGGKSKNFAEIAQELGLSRERIRQIQKEALVKILNDTREDLTSDIDSVIARSV